MTWDHTKVYVMRLIGSDTIGMWWFEEETPMKPGMWRTMRVGAGIGGDGIWHGEPTVSYGPGSFLKADWQLLKNPSPIKWDRLCDSEWIART